MGESDLRQGAPINAMKKPAEKTLAFLRLRFA
jgi:hypothetical protein